MSLMNETTEQQSAGLQSESNLPVDINTLHSIITNLNTEYKTLQENSGSKIHFLEGEIRYLNEKVKILTFRLFGRKREKLSPEEDLQGRLFDEFEKSLEAEDVKEEVKEEVIKIPIHERRKPGRKSIPEGLPRVTVEHDLSEEEKTCACGKQKDRIGEEVSEKLDIIPPKVQVIKHIRYKYACKCCDGLSNENDGAVTTALMPPQIIPQGIVTEGLLSYIITSKFADALPLYRQSKIFTRIGVDLSRSTLCSWILKSYEKVEILIDLMFKQLREYPVIGVDETRVQVLKEPGRENTAISFMWAFRGGGLRVQGKESPMILFSYSPSRSAKEMLGRYLDGYTGYIQSDGFESYDAAEKTSAWRHAGCWSHGRRGFFDAVKASGNTGLSQSILDRIRNLYAIEDKAKKGKLSYDEIKDLRQKESKPILDAIKERLDRDVSNVVPNSYLGKAVRYALKEWDKLIVYIEDGRIPIDNNLVENVIRPFVIGRKNWLFSGSPSGAIASAGYYSLIESAKANGLEPYWYLRYVFELLPYAASEDDLRALLPMYVDNQKFGLFIKERS